MARLFSFSTLGTAHNAPRFWIEGARLAALGFDAGTPIEVRPIPNGLTIAPAVLGEHVVSARRAAGGSRPIIDLNSHRLLSHLADYRRVPTHEIGGNVSTAKAKRAPVAASAPECECANCGWKGAEQAVAVAHDLLRRLEPGDEFPAGECPDCGALAYLIDKSKPEEDADEAAKPWHLLEELGNAVMHLHDMGGSGGTEAEGRVRKALREAAEHVDIPIE